MSRLIFAWLFCVLVLLDKWQHGNHAFILFWFIDHHLFNFLRCAAFFPPLISVLWEYNFFFFFEEFVPSVSYSCYVTFCLLSLSSTNSTRGATSFFLSIIPSICTWTDIWPAYSNKYTHLIFISTLFRMTYLILMLMFWLAF